MAHHFVDGGTDALGVTLKVEGGGCGVIFFGLLTDPVVDLLGGDSLTDVFRHIVQDRHVHLGALTDSLNLGRGLNHVGGGDHVSLTTVQCDFLVKIIVAFFIL